jgi:hypothetical protein
MEKGVYDAEWARMEAPPFDRIQSAA